MSRFTLVWPPQSVSIPGAATAANQVLEIAQLTGIHADTTALNGKTVHVDTGAVVVASSALPTGAATEATLSTLNGKVTAVNTGAVVVSSSALPTGAATSALQGTGNTSLSSIDGKLATLGQKTMAGSVPVVISSDQSAITVTGSITATNTANGATGSAVPAQATQVGGTDGTNLRALSVDSTGKLNVLNISGTVSLPTGAATEATLSTLNGKVTAVNTGAVVVASSALPSGAATEATLSTLNGKVTAVNTGAVVVASSALPSGAATEATLSTLNGKVTAVNTGAVVVASSALPSGASTETTQVANGVLVGAVNETAPASDTASSGLNGRLQRIAQRLTSLIALFPTSLGQKTMANSLAVTIASDQSSLTVTSSSGTYLAKGRNDYSSVNVTTAAYTTLIADTGSTAGKQIEIFDSSGETLVIALGAAASEVDKMYVNPGGNGVISLTVPANSRISIKAVTATASVGYVNLNVYG